MRPVGKGDQSDECLRQEEATAGIGMHVAIHITVDESRGIRSHIVSLCGSMSWGSSNNRPAVYHRLPVELTIVQPPQSRQD